MFKELAQDATIVAAKATLASRIAHLCLTVGGSETTFADIPERRCVGLGVRRNWVEVV